jgi:hypothetical protein
MTSVAGRRSSVPVATKGRTAVPWLTVLPLAVLLAFGDGFWTISLRTSVGEVGRAQAPFDSWLRESVVVLPMFVFAVLGALTLALAWFGPHPRRSRSVLATALLVVAAGTVAGVGWLLASSAYDYHLQVQQLRMMGSMAGRCTGDCLVRQQHASLLLQAKSVGYGSGILLATNVVVVGWLVAMRGGRLDSATTRGRGASGALPRRFTRADGVRLVLAAGLLGSAAVHAGMVLAGRPDTGIFTIGLTAAQTAVAVRLLVQPSQAGLVAAAVVSLGALALSTYSHIPGIPGGPHPAGVQPVGPADGMACLLEIGATAAALILLRTRWWLQRPPPSAHHMSLALVAVLGLTAFGLAGTGLAWFDVIGPTGGHVIATPHK